MNKESKRIFFIFLRYLILVLIALPNLFIFYLILTPLTVYPVNFLLNILYSPVLNGSQITINHTVIEIVDACVAGSAYYLLLLLNLAIPMSIKKRLASIAFSFALFLTMNIARISIFTILLINEFRYFDLTHKIFWYVLSGVLVFLAWFITIKTFKIRKTPFVSDIKFFYNQIKKHKK